MMPAQMQERFYQICLFISWTYQKGGVLVQLNGELDQATADKYGAVISGL